MDLEEVEKKRAKNSPVVNIINDWRNELIGLYGTSERSATIEMYLSAGTFCRKVKELKQKIELEVKK